MKIAVVTVHDSANFGSFLQAYALKYVLEQDGHDVSFVITRDKEYVRGLFYKLNLCREMVKHPFKTLKLYLYGRKKYRVFKAEQECFREIEIPELGDFDLAILGSDEIWNVEVPVFRNLVFYGKYSKNNIAYGVSAGRATPESFGGFDEIRDCISKIPAPLARDENTALAIESITGTRPEIVCDPTLLADKEIYFRTLQNKYINNHKCLMLYMYEPTPEVRKIIIDFARKQGLKLVSVGFYYSWCDYNLLCSPMEFCSALEKAEFVITTTFHGTIYSVINEKKFVCLPLSQKTTDILKRFGAEDAMLDFKDISVESLEDKFVNFSVDYTAVNERIINMREASLEKLRSQIRGIK